MKRHLGLFISLFILTYMALATEKNVLITKGYVVTPEEFRIGRKIYHKFCSSCHAGGKNGAPRLGNLGDWEVRLESGMEQLIQSVQEAGTGAPGFCPAKGALAELSSEEVRLAMAYMVRTSIAK